MLKLVSASVVCADEVERSSGQVSLPLNISVDVDQLKADIALLAQAAQRSLQVRQRLVDLGNLGPELVRFDVDDASATPAGELRIRLYLANALFELVAAVRAGQFDDLVVQE